MAMAATAEMCTNLGVLPSFINRVIKKRKRVADCQIVEYGCWNELPFELMEMILHYTDVTDRVRMAMVCKSWESVLKRKDIRVPPQFPWLLLPPHAPSNNSIFYDLLSPRAPNNCKSLRFYDMSHCKIHDLKLPKSLQGGWCTGSCKGWLIMVKLAPIVIKVQIFLFDPISGAHHKLPSLETLPCFQDNILYRFLDPCSVDDFIGTTVISSEDPSNCTVATIFKSRPHMLAFCRVGGERWSIYENEGSPNEDILFSNDTLYVLTKSIDQDSVAAYTFRSTDYEVSLKIIPFPCSHPILKVDEDDDNIEYEDEDFIITRTHTCTMHLVESSNGQLLLIRRLMDSFESMDDEEEEDADANEEEADANADDAIIQDGNEDDDAIYDINEEIEDDNEVADEQVVKDNSSLLEYYRTRKFEIYMLDPNIGTSCMTKLTSLGNQILFFSMTALSLVQARDFVGFQENCIYFIEDGFNNQQCKHSPLVSRDSGIFYLDDERIERSFPSVKLPLQSHMGWFTPNALNRFISF